MVAGSLSLDGIFTVAVQRVGADTTAWSTCTADTTKQDAARMEQELRAFFRLIEGKSPLEIGAYRQAGMGLAARGGLVSATAFSAIRARKDRTAIGDRCVRGGRDCRERGLKAT